MKMICEVPDEVIKCIKDGTWYGSSVAEKMIANGIPLNSSEEPCEDAISRKEAISIASIATLSVNQVVTALNKLPPVTPQESKIGHWIVDVSVDCYLDKVRCHCSECGKKKEFPADYDHIKQELSISYKYPEVIDNFCPNCGAKMQEGSDKE